MLTTQLQSIKEKQQLIQQIANNFSGKDIAYTDNIHESEFKLSINGQEIITMQECACDNLFNRRKDPYRLHIEENIVNLVIQQITNNLEQIQLVCLGSDWVGLSVILAKLYQYGYKNFSISNVEFPGSLENAIFKNDLCLKFWQELFCDASIECTTVAGIDDNGTLSSSVDYFFKARLIVFAEDLGGTRPNSMKMFNGIKGATSGIDAFVNVIVKNKQTLSEKNNQEIFCVYGNDTIKSILINIENVTERIWRTYPTLDTAKKYKYSS